jgi:kynurenine formamidase
MVLDDRTPTYPADPTYSAEQFLTKETDGANVLKLSLGTHCGTHVDLPLHHIPGGSDAMQLPLDVFCGSAVVVRVPKGAGEIIRPQELQSAKIKPGDIVLVATGWDSNIYEPDYFTGFPGFSSDCADYLISKGVKCVGCDMPSVDPPGAEPAFHNRVLSAGIGIVEALKGLTEVTTTNVTFYAFPLKISGGDGSPVRAVAIE